MPRPKTAWELKLGSNKVCAVCGNTNVEDLRVGTLEMFHQYGGRDVCEWHLPAPTEDEQPGEHGSPGSGS